MMFFDWLFPPRPPVPVPPPELPPVPITVKSRIAQAIADNLPGARAEDMHYPVIAALHAMREPTDTMIKAGFWYTQASRDDAVACWQDMIDAALNEGGQ